MFPIKDNIPTDRFPVVTVALIALNVIAYFFWQKGGLSFGDPIAFWKKRYISTLATISVTVTTGKRSVGMLSLIGNKRR